MIILLVGAGVSWWSARATNAVEQHVRHEVIELIPLVRDNPSIIERMVVDPVLFPTKHNAIASLDGFK